ncbi:class II glutamine amidotransferase [Phreatobacter sp. AB_2022a]|nr:class II glutamine amidotransferase [Phreatobacter sp. AB_2022a]MCZ0733722.1 class II glutamine amidotransferase [Phreatobacter sp. AB_2022a]
MRHEAKTGINADGFGIGWYGERAVPGLFRDIMPAWSDENLRAIAHQVRSRLFLAHVRASTGTPTSRVNCHPFAGGPWLFVHNGQIGDFPLVRRRLESLIPDALYGERQGATDSELIFLLMRAHGLAEDAMAATRRALADIVAAMTKAGANAPLRFTACFTDGETIHAVRFASDERPPTLYCGRTENGWLVVSEPLDMDGQRWRAVPPDHWVTLTPQGPMVEPFRLH